MKKKLIGVALCVFGYLTVSAQWIQDANGNLSTSKTVSMGGEVRITTPYAPLYLKTGFESFIDLSSQQQGYVGYLPGENVNFVWGMFSGTTPALRVGKVVSTEWNNIGLLSAAIGENVGAEGSYSLSVGKGTRASGFCSVAFGLNSNASGQYSFAGGYGSIASHFGSSALGRGRAQSQYATAVGDSYANGLYSFSAGKSGVNAGDYGASFGTALVDGDYGFAAGISSYAYGFASTALSYSQALGQYSLSSGNQTIAQGSNSIAMGQYSTAQSTNSVVIGAGISASYKLVNSLANSFMVGFNSNLATLYVGPSNGYNTFGKVGIGTTNPQSELAVNGTITAKALNLTMIGWPDYVFSSDYKRMGLDETEKYIDEHKHLPGVPSAHEIESNGLNVGEMNRIMMEKIEEITLHLIEIKKENVEMKKENTELRKQLNELKDMK